MFKIHRFSQPVLVSLPSSKRRVSLSVEFLRLDCHNDESILLTVVNPKTKAPYKKFNSVQIDITTYLIRPLNLEDETYWALYYLGFCNYE